MVEHLNIELTKNTMNNINYYYGMDESDREQFVCPDCNSTVYVYYFWDEDIYTGKLVLRRDYAECMGCFKRFVVGD